MRITEDVEIVLDGQRYLLEAGDKILIEGTYTCPKCGEIGVPDKSQGSPRCPNCGSLLTYKFAGSSRPSSSKLSEKKPSGKPGARFCEMCYADLDTSDKDSVIFRKCQKCDQYTAHWPAKKAVAV